MSILPKLLSSLASSIFSVEKRCHCPLVFNFNVFSLGYSSPKVSVFIKCPIYSDINIIRTCKC
jgi:hypothetical protein